MSGSKPNTRKEVSEPELPNSDKRKQRVEDLDLEFDVDLSSNIKGILSALQQIRELFKDGQKKNDETISSVAGEIKSMIDDFKSEFEKDRQVLGEHFRKAQKSSLLDSEIDNNEIQQLVVSF